ncbi:TrmH family RNA methyltransferase [Gephyromycinifex aptenodytis]|uniref:TrmH family RNA methyltransferase n=1 Tax=Gephyromycinifex aptenodytis TaxID=2716227 RepID=UPI001447C887|nr:RNA methyltransferase [Gephyromycinifex aptenodytis]
MPDLQITSPANARLRHVASLRRRRVRDAEGVTLIDGFAELSLALDAGLRPQTLYWCPELLRQPQSQQHLVDRVRERGSEIVHLSRSAFEKVAYREGPDGVLAVVASPQRTLDQLAVTAGLVLVCEGVEKPGNLGAMLRTADAAGVDAMLAADPVTDWGNPNVVRGSKGTVFSVPVASCDTAEMLAWVKTNALTLVATTPDTDLDYADVDYTGPVAIAVGAEQTGLSEEVLAAATHRVRIPMAGAADSLNVSISAAVVLYEAVRQRRRR